MADTLAWAFAYINNAMAGERGVPEAHPDDPPPTEPMTWPTAPHIVVCAQCGDECDTLCIICGGGIHAYPCTSHHDTGDCVGEANWPDWLWEYS